MSDLRRRLERLPPGHPSSPYNDDLTRKAPVFRLKDLELPLHGTENGPNGNGSRTAAGHGHGPAGAPAPGGNTISEGTGSEGTASESTVRGNTITGNTAGGDTATRNAAAGDTATRDAAGRDTAAGNTAPGNTARGNTASGNGMRGNDAAAGRLDAANGLAVLSGRLGTAAAGEQDGNGFDRYETAAGTYAPASEPYETAADPYEPAAEPYEPAAGRYNGATDSYEPAAGRYNGAADLYEPATELYGAAADPYDATADPYDATADPYDATADPYDATADPYDATANSYDPAGEPFDGADDDYAPAAHPYDAADDDYAPAAEAYTPGSDPYDASAEPHRPGGEPFEAADVAGHGWSEPEPGVDTLTQAAVGATADDGADMPHIGRDGSWEWNGRYLSAEESHIADEALGRCRIAEGRNVFGGYGHSGLTPAMRRIEAQLEHGNLLPDTEDRALKKLDGFKQTLADLIMRHPDKSARELALEVPDGISYTFIFEREHYADATLQAHSRLKGSGFDLEVRRNCWDNAEYKGVSSRWRDPAHDLVFAVQFHTAASWGVVQRAHPLYEAMTDPSTPHEEREHLRAIYAEMSAMVPVPPGATAIPEYRKEGA